MPASRTTPDAAADVGTLLLPDTAAISRPPLALPRLPRVART
jgi:hypothetical protein